MKTYKNQSLAKYTHFRVGGIANNFYIPESTQQLMELHQSLSNPLYLSGGSNVLINDRKSFNDVICLRKFDKSVQLEKGIFTIGASASIQKVVSIVQGYGFGGIEYLYSVPALLGGVIVMNAGRGRTFNESISDYVISVQCLTEDGVVWLSNESCEFGYRNSIFLKKGYLVLSVKLKLPKQDPLVTEALKSKRLQYCKQDQDDAKPNFGTVFCQSNSYIMKMMRLTPLGKCKGVRYSKKLNNWMLNDGVGKFSDAKKLIDRTMLVHRLLGMKCKPEVVIWE